MNGSHFVHIKIHLSIALKMLILKEEDKQYHFKNIPINKPLTTICTIFNYVIGHSVREAETGSRLIRAPKSSQQRRSPQADRLALTLVKPR